MSIKLCLPHVTILVCIVQTDSLKNRDNPFKYIVFYFEKLLYYIPASTYDQNSQQANVASRTVMANL